MKFIFFWAYVFYPCEVCYRSIVNEQGGWKEIQKRSGAMKKT